MKATVNSLVGLIALTGLSAVSSIANADVTGNIGVASKYVLRGITETYNATYDNSGPEQDSPALQGGLDYTNANGLYAGYWFSTIGYSYANLNPDKSKTYSNSVENDLYGGYNGKIGSLGYTVGCTVYYYQPGWESLGYETKVGVSFGDAAASGSMALTAQTLLNDVTFGNKGDTYFLASYSKNLPQDFTFNGQVGFYTYKKDGKFIAGTVGDVVGKSSAFRQATLGITHPLAAKGATWGMQYIIGGDNRYGIKQHDAIVGTVGLTF